MNAIGVHAPGPVDTAHVKTLQDQIDLARQLGGIAQVNHPSWQGPHEGKGILTTDRLLETSGATLLEVWAGVAATKRSGTPIFPPDAASSSP